MEEAVVEVFYKGSLFAVTLRELTFREYNSIMRKYIKISLEGGVATIKDIDYFGIEEDILRTSIKEIKFVKSTHELKPNEAVAIPSKEEFLNGLSNSEGQKLKRKAMELNPLQI
ncbi:hypothetical protein JDFR1000234_57 [uncultured archaeal virus]|jgi:hypothetical protein|uniref:Uncharacterized protein n=1 Tax=uncultured archaeal virus TaxID=1960247 RepID=A0A1S5Y368_9VIRU|nr:hypothetical protein JDFR1000234_57 [uncultured archaeal virus]